MPNQLAQETSPYLRQHADNPVDWYPWGEEALQKARAENKPILLSIGYAACHWCHVMAHESFEDPATAVFMNRHFVNIKVDREERPDLDAIYMQAVVALTGQGGWPMTVFLTPEGRPFYGGTYFPPAPRYGMPSFIQLMQSIATAWETKRDDILQSAGEITNHLQRTAVLTGQADVLTPGMFGKATAALAQTFDHERGGFGGAPKFPPSMTLEYLLQSFVLHKDSRALHMAETTLKQMAYGGMYDQIGGGFARYSTDVNWLVPHFEKMLYDNALLARAYLHAYQVTQEPLYRRIVEETLDFVGRELRHEDGGFYSSYDADSEGEEGKFYVWSAAEIDEHLGEDAALFKLRYGVTERGNWEESNILNIQKELDEVAWAVKMSEAKVAERLAVARQKLYDVRSQRVWPGLDDKVLTAWNGLMLAAFAEAGRVLERPDYTATAVHNAHFLYQTMRTANGRLLRTWKAGGAGDSARYNGYLEDYAYLADGLLALYQTTFDEQWFTWAHELAEQMLTHFHDAENGGFYDTSDDHEALIHRPKDLQDNAVPSANAMAAHVLLRLSLYTGEMRYWDVAETAVSALYGAMVQYPNAFAHWLGAAVFITSQPQEVAIIGDPGLPDTKALINTTFAAFRPNLVVAAGGSTSRVPLLADRKRLNDKATAYVCRRFVCQQPVNSPEALAEQLTVAALS
ncbi:MAG: thioredoxin domain-containing protein [Anaerolineae bacterium]|nr:thioredoxin domain-containing protein [Anaerolineae bacterium]